jgi:hypothetical protein
MPIISHIFLMMSIQIFQDAVDNSRSGLILLVPTDRSVCSNSPKELPQWPQSSTNTTPILTP